MTSILNSLILVVHGESGVGKSWLADSIPEPRLILDVEGRAKFTPSQPKVIWDPLREEPPKITSGTCIVFVRDFSTIQRVYQWLDSGQHPFNSVGFDSLTEAQRRCKDMLVGTGAMQQQDWGALLTRMESLVRDFRDLTTHPVKPLQVVMFNCLTTEVGRDVAIRRPLVQGQLMLTLPGFGDVVGYMWREVDAQTGQAARKLLIQPQTNFVAKDGTDRLTQHYGSVIENPDVLQMLAVLSRSQTGG